MRLADVDAAQAMLTIYSAKGQELANYTPSTGPDVHAAWLPDASGLFVWRTDPSSDLPGPISIVDLHGHAHPTGLTGIDPILSPDGAWIAADDISAYPQQSSVVVAPRSGGAHILAQHARFLGWQGQHIVFDSMGVVYAVLPSGGSPAVIAQAPAQQDLQPLPTGPDSSPDGTVLVVQTARGQPLLLSESHLQGQSAQMLLGDPVMWVGPHDMLGRTVQNHMLIVDARTGAVVKDTGLVIPGNIAAVSGTWIAWEDLASSAFGDLHIANFQTRTDHDLGPLPIAGQLLPWGPGQFLLYGAGEVYDIDATSMS